MFKAIYITEAGKNVGFGHLKRSSALSTILPDFEMHVALERSLSLDWNHSYTTWDAQLPLGGLLDQYDLVIFDSFHGSRQTYVELEKHPCVLHIDDYVRRSLKKGLVVDWTVGAESRQPSGEAQCYGVKYLVTRPQFYKPKTRFHREKITEVTTIFGGSDPFDMTTEVATLLQSYPKVKIRHLGTKHYPSYQKFKNDKRFHWDLSDHDFSDYLASSDVVITAGGQTLYELASLGVPAIALSVATNQDDDIKGFTSLGTCKVLTGESFSQLVSLLEALSPSDRMRMSQASEDIDGRGLFLKIAINEFINERISI